VLVASILILLLIQCNTAEPDLERNLQITDEILFDTDSNDIADEKLISFITEFVTDDQGRQYIVDARNARIRVFDESGNFLRYIGQEGSGPGEFQDISTLHINKNDELIAADPNRGRISTFSLDGELLSTHRLPVADVNKITEAPDGGYLIVGYDGGKLVHLVDSNFKNVQASLVSVEEILHTQEQLEEIWIQYDAGQALMLSEESILYAPSIYAGKLYRYKLINGEGWQFSETVDGYGRHENPVTFSPFQQVDRVDAPLSLPDGRFAAQFHSSSQGLFRNGADSFMHFSLQEDGSGDKLDLIAEQFNSEGKLLYYGVIDSMEQANVTVHWMQNESIYLFDRKDQPLLKQITIVK
jgi:hypothetical protein